MVVVVAVVVVVVVEELVEEPEDMVAVDVDVDWTLLPWSTGALVPGGGSTMTWVSVTLAVVGVGEEVTVNSSFFLSLSSRSWNHLRTYCKFFFYCK